MKLPFQITPEVIEQILWTVKSPPGKNSIVALIWTPRSSIDGHDFEDVFGLGVYPIDQREPNTFFEFGKYQISITPGTLDKLKGKTLTLEVHTVITNSKEDRIHLLKAV